jgi:hypothetical protein
MGYVEDADHSGTWNASLFMSHPTLTIVKGLSLAPDPDHPDLVVIPSANELTLEALGRYIATCVLTEMMSCVGEGFVVQSPATCWVTPARRGEAFPTLEIQFKARRSLRGQAALHRAKARHPHSRTTEFRNPN